MPPIAENARASTAGPITLHRSPITLCRRGADPARMHCLTAAFAKMLRDALAGEPHPPTTSHHSPSEEWLLLLEDDLGFHPRLRAQVESWPALRDPRCAMACLFNPSLRATARWGEMACAFAAEPASFQGPQALLLRPSAARRALAAWDDLAMEGTAPSVPPGDAPIPAPTERCPPRGLLPSHRLAPFLGASGPLWIHRPSLVQHLATDSSWGARIYRALDFDVC